MEGCGYKLEAIRGHRVEDGAYLFNVKWDCFTEGDNTWESAAGILSKDILLAYCKQNGIPESALGATQEQVVHAETQPTPALAMSDSPDPVASKEAAAQSHYSVPAAGYPGGDPHAGLPSATKPNVAQPNVSDIVVAPAGSQKPPLYGIAYSFSDNARPAIIHVNLRDFAPPPAPVPSSLPSYYISSRQRNKADGGASSTKKTSDPAPSAKSSAGTAAAAGAGKTAKGMRRARALPGSGSDESSSDDDDSDSSSGGAGNEQGKAAPKPTKKARKQPASGDKGSAVVVLTDDSSSSYSDSDSDSDSDGSDDSDSSSTDSSDSGRSNATSDGSDSEIGARHKRGRG